MQPSRYLKTFVIFTILQPIFIALLVIFIDPFGLSPSWLTRSIPNINSNKISRNENDRLIKPYDAIMIQPKTIVMGTSRVKQAFDPKYFDAKFAPVYNAGVDALQLFEAREMLENFIKQGLPIKRVYMEVFPHQFGYDNGAWQSTRGIMHGRNWIADTIKIVFAWREAIDTIVSNYTKQYAVFTNRNGFRNISGPHPGPDFAPFSPYPAVSRNFQKFESAFSELDKIIALCADHSIDLKFFIGPIHPVSSLTYIKHWEQLSEWLTYLSKRANVVSFLTVAEFRDLNPVNTPKPYYCDSSHFSSEAAKLIIKDLESFPNLQHGRILKSENLPQIISEWKANLKAWVKINPDYLNINEFIE